MLASRERVRLGYRYSSSPWGSLTRAIREFFFFLFSFCSIYLYFSSTQVNSPGRVDMVPWHMSSNAFTVPTHVARTIFWMNVASIVKLRNNILIIRYTSCQFYFVHSNSTQYRLINSNSTSIVFRLFFCLTLFTMSRYSKYLPEIPTLSSLYFK